MALSSMLTQYFPPPPTLTESSLPSQKGKIFIITGGNAGVGLELIKLLYPTGATIYMASRSSERASAAIKTITSSNSENAKNLKFLQLDLNDLHSVRAAAKKFQNLEGKLDVLWNNAGIGTVPVGTKTEQGIEANMGVNVIGPLLFSTLLVPQLRAAAASAPAGSVRVVWTSSWMMEGGAPKGGYTLSELEKGGSKDATVNYSTSKAANFIVSNEFQKRYGKEGIVSVCQNPGNLNTTIYDSVNRVVMVFVRWFLLHPVKMGAYTEVFAGLGEGVGGGYVIPWGRVQERRKNPRGDIWEAMENGKGEVLWEWCFKKIDACKEKV
ncbi:NAD(P)-binding Rossmann-fold containing protein [Glarea lozoyensis ATCC 20868]|uniref:NAD(P)-binding Rossmann-fold containing protein n=1 Tax=Glarea lozoyensis (strain ATCC 20868 / MF5171) TaxID=1116229 RepID=S3CKH8_GLAL2|nr:NAD(P)-binding Rossmann-fold containing protein [Glarea lozoyensis ATCC 20868]EPE26245.1 NAD(P)-binding Rossmann-fold containing protein [Glarea lozoyensis ATCC 20868]